MRAPAPASIWDRSPLAKLFRWLSSRRVLRRIFIVFTWVAAIVTVYYAVENWSGRRAWKRYERQLVARGEQLDFSSLIPKPVPDEQNFAATPFVKSWFVRGTSESNVWRDSYARISPKILTVPSKTGLRDLLDLSASAKAFAAAAVPVSHTPNAAEVDERRAAAEVILEAMRSSDAKLDELRRASARRFAVYPIKFQDDVWSILLPHLVYLKSASQRLQVMACAKLACGQAAAALDDVKLMLYLADSIKDEPFAVSYLRRLACLDLAIQVIWEGLAQRSWSERDLYEMQTKLQEYDSLQELKRALRAEHAAGLNTPQLIRKYGINYVLTFASTPGDTETWPKPVSAIVGWIIPSGWLHQEKLNYSRFFLQQQHPLFQQSSEAKPRISPTAVESTAAQIRQELRAGSVLRGHKLFAGLLVPQFGKIPLRTARAQTSKDHATLACALERYRLAQGSFPEKLDGLVPQFIAQLPNDLLTGQPYKYRRTDDGQFILYSVGWNETDEGGTPGEEIQDEQQGDWVWSYPQRRN